MFASFRPLLLCNRVRGLREATAHDNHCPVDRILIASARAGGCWLFGIESSRDVQGHDSVAVVYDDGGSEAATCFGGGKEPNS